MSEPASIPDDITEHSNLEQQHHGKQAGQQTQDDCSSHDSSTLGTREVAKENLDSKQQHVSLNVSDNHQAIDSISDAVKPKTNLEQTTHEHQSNQNASYQSSNQNMSYHPQSNQNTSNHESNHRDISNHQSNQNTSNEDSVAKENLDQRLAFWQDQDLTASHAQVADSESQNSNNSNGIDREEHAALDSVGKDRNQTLLNLARKDRKQFLNAVTPPLADLKPKLPSDSGKEEIVQEAQVALDETGFAFPVTKQLFTFLGRFANRELEATTTRRETSNSSASASARERQAQYTKLLEKLSDPSMSSIVKGIKSFVIQFNSSSPPRDVGAVSATSTSELWSDDKMPGEGNPDGPLVRDFIQNLCRKVRSHPRWERIQPQDWIHDEEGLEKLVTSRIYDRAFCPTLKDHSLDEYLKRRIRSLSFVQPAHLDIRNTIESPGLSWSAAATELAKLSDYRAPRDKMICLLNSCRIITKLLTRSAELEGKVPGADEFLPALIYVVLRANPDQLHSNIEFIASFRNPKKLILEPGYFFTHLTSAVAFIHRIDASMLSISKQEFDKGIQAASTHPTAYTESLPTDDDQMNNSEVGVAQSSQAEMIMLPANGKAFTEWKEVHGRFQDVSVTNMLHRDVPAVLSEYKYLYSLCEKLLKERTASNGA